MEKEFVKAQRKNYFEKKNAIRGIRTHKSAQLEHNFFKQGHML